MADFTFAQLTPTAFLDRSALVFGEHTAVLDRDRRFSYAELAARCGRLTGALAALGVEPGDRVAALCTNSHVMLELHHGVPMRGAILVPLNIRLSVDELEYIVAHSGAQVLVATVELADSARQVAERTDVRLVVATGDADDEYESLLEASSPQPVECQDERGLVAINYTSGTTGRPKGVMYHHRGAYLQSLAVAFHNQLTAQSRYLWTLPMFHCNGWCYTWAVGAAGGTHVCLRAVDPGEIWRLLHEEAITHFSAAPTVLSMIADDPGAAAVSERTVRVTTGGAPPSPTLISTLTSLGMDVTHLYGLTETYGPLAVNEWKQAWDSLPGDERSVLTARQGVSNVLSLPLRVVGSTGSDVPADGSTIGEIVTKGNNVMLGYYRDEQATAASTVDGWFRTGDLAVMHPDNYVEIRDRAKDIIISGGENIASVEVEQALDSHPAVLECAVVGVPDEKWGEVPIAYVTLRQPAASSSHAASASDTLADELVDHVRARLAGFKAPQRIVFGDLPKTATGKIQKHVLRAQGR